MKKCKFCNEEFKPYRKTSLYCSKKCNKSFNYYKNKKKITRKCKVCNVMFDNKKANAIYCSKKCGNIADNTKNKDRYKISKKSGQKKTQVMVENTILKIKTDITNSLKNGKIKIKILFIFKLINVELKNLMLP